MSGIRQRRTDANSSVDGEESVLRRVPLAFYPDRERPDRPVWNAFKPTEHDTDGLSVGRRALVSSLEAYAISPRGERSLAQVAVADLQSLDMSVRPDPLPDDEAHAIIPELNIDAYKRDKTRIRNLAMRISREFATMVYIARDGV